MITGKLLWTFLATAMNIINFQNPLVAFLFVCFWPNCPPPPVGQGLLIHEVSRSHTTTHHSWLDSSGRVISSSQRTLPDNTHTHTFTTDKHPCPAVGFEATIPAGERPHNYALDRAATGTGVAFLCFSLNTTVCTRHLFSRCTNIMHACSLFPPNSGWLASFYGRNEDVTPNPSFTPFCSNAPWPSYITSLFSLSQFRRNALYLAALCYANTLLLMEIF